MMLITLMFDVRLGNGSSLLIYVSFRDMLGLVSECHLFDIYVLFSSYCLSLSLSRKIPQAL